MNKQKIVRLFRTYMLIIAISAGFFIFLAFHNIKSLTPLKPFAWFIATDGLPILIFVMLFCAFCKVKIKDMKPKPWHFYIIAIQVLIVFIFALFIAFNKDSSYKIPIEGIIICFITPTAASAAVLAGKLGGNESSLTSFILLNNIASAIAIPLVFPIFCEVDKGSFLVQFLILAKRVFPVIVLPLFLAFFVRKFLKKFHNFIITNCKDLGLYLWVICLTVVSSRTFANIINSNENTNLLWGLALVGLLCTVFQFLFGKFIGSFSGQRVTAGQAMGQKNMVFGLWVSLIYLTPSAAIAPGCYILWQNLVNAYQMWYREHKLKEWENQGKEPYQE